MSIQLEPPHFFWTLSPAEVVRRLRARGRSERHREPLLQPARSVRPAVPEPAPRLVRPLYGLAAAMNVLYQSNVPWVESEAGDASGSGNQP